jgi:hypothetical protein
MPPQLTPEQEVELLTLLNSRPKRASDATAGEQLAEVGRSFARGGVMAAEGIADVADVGIEVLKGPSRINERLNAEVNPFTDEVGPRDAARQEFYDSPLMKSLTQEKIQRGQSGVLDTAKTAGEWAPSLISPSKVTAGGREALQNAVEMFIGSTSAGLGERAAGEQGEVVSGVLGSIFSGNIANGFRSLRDTIMRNRGVDAKVAEQQVARFFNENATDIDAAMGQVQQNLDEGVQGTTAQLTGTGARDADGLVQGDRGLFSIEDAFTNTREAALPLARARQQRSNQIGTQAGQQFDMAEGGVRALPNATRQIEQQTGASVERLDAARLAEQRAQQGVTDAQGVVAPKGPTFQTSEQLAQTLDTSQASYDKAFKAPAWQEFDQLRGKNGGIASEPFKKTVENYVLRKLSPKERQIFNDTYMKELNYIDSLNDLARPSEIAFLISRLKTISANAAKNNNTTATEKFLTEAGLRMENMLLNTDGAGEAYARALNATIEGTEQFGARNLGNARRVAEPETLGAQFVKSGDEGAVSADALAQSPPEVIAATGEYLKSLAAKEGLTPEFIKKYDGFLTRFPDQNLVGELRAAANAETGLVQAKAALDTVTKAEADEIARINKTVLADFTSKPDATMKTLLTNPDAAGRLDELITAIDDPAAVRDAFRNTFMKQIDQGTDGAQRFTPTSFGKFQELEPTLERLFADAPQELEQLRTIMYRPLMDSLSRTQSGTKLSNELTEIEKLAASGAAATVLNLGGFTGTNALMLGGAVRRWIMGAVSKGGAKLDDAKIKVVSDMLADPNEFMRIMEASPPTKQDKSLSVYVARVLNGVAQPLFAAAVSTND